MVMHVRRAGSRRRGDAPDPFGEVKSTLLYFADVECTVRTNDAADRIRVEAIDLHVDLRAGGTNAQRDHIRSMACQDKCARSS